MVDESDRFDRVVPIVNNRSHSNLSNLEKNCNQIFIKGPALTKDFFEKIQTDLVPTKTDLFGYQMNTRRLILLTGLILLFTFSSMGTITMWFTDSYQKSINSMMILSEESFSFDTWKAPTPRPYIKIYIFNYTNVNEYESGRPRVKLHVEETGPYAYYEELERVNVRFNKVDGTVSYQEKRTYRFSPELSKGTQDDYVTVPNVPMLAGASVAKQQFNFLMRFSYSAVLKSLSEKAFVTLNTGSFIGGYEDHLYDLSKNYLKFQDKRVFEHFGLLSWKAGVQPDIITMNTGVHNISKLGQIEKFNGESELNLWSSESCNRLQASDGLIYPANLVKAKKNLTFFVPQMCRKLPLYFEKEVTMLDKVPVYRYKVPLEMFDSADNNEENRCYCNRETGGCTLQGVFNATACAFGAPVYYSLPHLYGADPTYLNSVTGLKKDIVVNDTFVDIHPRMGVLLGGKLKIQVNIQVHPSFGISELNGYEDGMMLPLVWVETGLAEQDLPEDAIHLIYKMTFTVRNLELGLKYGCLLATMVTLTCILLVLKKHRENRHRTCSTRSTRPLRTLDDIEQ